MPDWYLIDIGRDDTVVEYGHTLYRVTATGAVYVRYYRRYPKPRNGIDGIMVERRLKPAGILAMSALHAARSFESEHKEAA